MKKILHLLKDNKAFNALLNNESLKEVDFSSLKLSVGGGMAIQQSVATRWHDLTGCSIIEGYGMTECSPLIAACPITVVKHNGTIGVPVPNTDIKIIDENGKEAALGQPGNSGSRVNR